MPLFFRGIHDGSGMGRRPLKAHDLAVCQSSMARGRRTFSPVNDRALSPTLAGIYAKELTANPKLGPVSATYVAQLSCPASCPLLGSGCYAENGFTSMAITKRLIRGVLDGTTPAEIAQREASAIDALSGERALRLHVVGDSTTIEGTRALAAAARRYSSRHDRPVWTYTHAWRSLPRSAWGSVSVLASCENERDLIAAKRRGYATALVVPGHRARKLYQERRTKLLPCPEQTSGVSCAACGLCMRDDYLRDAGITIAFAAHGSPASKSKALRALSATAVRDSRRRERAA